jgi:hypothetical protein
VGWIFWNVELNLLAVTEFFVEARLTNKNSMQRYLALDIGHENLRIDGELSMDTFLGRFEIVA